MIRCFRVGFVGAENPEDTLTAVLQDMEAHGHVIIGVSVLRPGPASRETYEVYIVARLSDDDGEAR